MKKRIVLYGATVVNAGGPTVAELPELDAVIVIGRQSKPDVDGDEYKTLSLIDGTAGEILDCVLAAMTMAHQLYGQKNFEALIANARHVIAKGQHHDIRSPTTGGRIDTIM
jgi:hypothetical protein